MQGLPHLPSFAFTIFPSIPAPSVGPRNFLGLDTNAADIQPLGVKRLAGSFGKAADSGHVHPISGGTAIDTNAADIRELRTAALAGAIGKAADAGHIHPATFGKNDDSEDLFVVLFGTLPILGALQPGIASQSVTGNDVAGLVAFTTTGAPPGAGGLVVLLDVHGQRTNPVMVFGPLTNPAAGATDTQFYWSNGAGFFGLHFEIHCIQALLANTTYTFPYILLGTA
jgi:hypothetical protein